MKCLVSWISLNVHVRFNQTLPYLVNGSGEKIQANQNCTNSWYQKSLLGCKKKKSRSNFTHIHFIGLFSGWQ